MEILLLWKSLLKARDYNKLYKRFIGIKKSPIVIDWADYCKGNFYE
jgi:hypothetical protein